MPPALPATPPLATLPPASHRLPHWCGMRAARCYSLDECGAPRSAVLVPFGGGERRSFAPAPAHCARHRPAGPALTAADTVTNCRVHLGHPERRFPTPGRHVAVLRAAAQRHEAGFTPPAAHWATGSVPSARAAQLRTMSFSEELLPAF